jgi:hypothetical protein
VTTHVTDDPTTGLDLLMVHADDHEPALPSLPERAAYSSAEPVPDTSAAHLAAHSSDPDDLGLQRWGVIAPEGPRGDRLLALIAPLIAKREADQGGHEPRIYRVPPQMSPEEAALWKKRVYDDQSSLTIELPRYQLVLGDLHEVPLSLQQVQSIDGFVGRLAFDRDDDYAAYVDKVLRWESAPAPHAEGRAVFHTVHDGTRATQAGFASLVRPGMALARTYKDKGYFKADRIVESGDPLMPTAQGFLDAATPDRPGVMLSVSHGQGPPRAGWASHEERLAGQGAMSFKREVIRGDDLRDATFLPGGVWFMLACFGAGTPDRSAYWHWLKRLQSEGQFQGDIAGVLAGLPTANERPFVAQVPKSVLASTNGPLAFIGHVDLAWTYGFRDLDDGAKDRPAKYLSLLHSALEGNRVGLAFDELFRYVHSTNSELATAADRAEEDRARGLATSPDLARQAHLWMLRNDLGAYVLLGDPAARLPITRAGAQQVTAPTSPQAVSFGGAPAPTATLPLPIERLEEAICKVLLGDESPKAIAAEYGISRGELSDLAGRYQEAGRRALLGQG